MLKLHQLYPSEDKQLADITCRWFEEHAAMMAHKCRVLQLEGLLEASREENVRLKKEIERLTGRNEQRVSAGV